MNRTPLLLPCLAITLCLTVLNPLNSVAQEADGKTAQDSPILWDRLELDQKKSPGVDKEDKSKKDEDSSVEAHDKLQALENKIALLEARIKELESKCDSQETADTEKE